MNEKKPKKPAAKPRAVKKPVKRPPTSVDVDKVQAALDSIRGTDRTIPAPGHVLVMRACTADMKSYNGAFTWPTSGHVEAPDWDSSPSCGHGLHGWLYGEGDASAAEHVPWSDGARWLAVEVKADGIVDLGGKVKFRAGTVVFCGDREATTRFVLEHGGHGKAIIGGTATAGDCGTATAGDCGTATAGDGGTATAGDGGTATAGDGGTATAGARGTATAGDCGTATAGARGTATAGDGGSLVLRTWDGTKLRYRVLVADVGENGILPGVAYRVDDDGRRLVPVDEAHAAKVRAENATKEAA